MADSLFNTILADALRKAKEEENREMKASAFIELHLISDGRKIAINVDHISAFSVPPKDENSGAQLLVFVINDSKPFQVIESYDCIKYILDRIGGTE